MILFKRNALPLILLSMVLAACSFDSPTKLTPEKLQLVQTVDQDVYATNNLTSDVLKSIALMHLENDGGEMAVTVSYDAQSSVNTKSKAELAGKKIVETLRAEGVKDIAYSTLPVGSPPEYSVTTIRYVHYDARGPEDCDFIPGYKDRSDAGSTEIHQDYDYGCTIETLFARQVANPSDLAGKDGFDTKINGRKAANAIFGTGYYEPGPSPDLTGENASEN